MKTPPDSALGDARGIIADLRCQVAERTAERDEALAQQTATAEVLQVINSSPGDLAPVFDAMLEKATSLCEASFGYLLTYDGEHLHSAADRGHCAFAAWVRAQGSIRPEPGTTNARLVAGEDVVHIPDVTDEAGFPGNSAVRRAVIEVGGFRTMLSIALRKDGVLLGVIHVYRQEVRPFTDKQIALVQNFAAQAVIAMENARLLGELRERTGDLQESLEYQTATSDVLKVISQSTFDLEPVLEFVCRTAARLCNVQTGSIFRLEEGVYRWATGFGLEPSYEAVERSAAIAPGMGTLVGRVALTGETVHILDGMADPHYEAKEGLQLSKCHTLLGVPLLREGAVIGVICMARFAIDAFTEKQVALVSTFADQAIIAIENARLFNELRGRTTEVTELNRGLEARVAQQVDELGRVGRLKRFLAPQLAEMIVSHGDEKILESHRREIVVVFCDLRGYTAFTETSEPEEVLDFLREYHGALGPLVSQFEGTLDQFSGDGIMVFFNDPVPISDPAERAVKMAMAMRDACGSLIAAWRQRGRELGFGAGIAQGYATLGQIGFSERSGYTAIGTVCNVAARLCAEAKDGQILLSQRVNVALNGSVVTEQVGALALKGLTQPVVAYNVPLAAPQPTLRVIEGGPQTL
jgi:class 3 adenylate cyclase